MIYTLWQNSTFCQKKFSKSFFWKKLSYFHSVFYNICYTNDRKASDLYKNKNGE